MQAQQPTTATICAHHWRIATPSGEYSRGICTKCNEERLFSNSPEAASYGYGRSRPRTEA